MKNIVRKILKQIQEDKIKRRRMRTVLLVLSLFVASGVLWQLKITGITMTSEALCGFLEHQHTESCVNKVLSCKKQESEGHVHSDLCYEIISTPDCTTETHQHEEGVCFIQEQKLICQQDEHDGHAHGKDCYVSEYICGYEIEHIHTVLCYSDFEADLENSRVWKATLPTLTGKFGTDLVAVAKSQVGYTESEQNYKVADDGITKMGYTRYGEWYGNPHGNWSAMFVSFCLHYAEHPAYEQLKSSGVETMRLAAQKLGYCQKVGYQPESGDLLFLDKNADSTADAVAVVTGNTESGIAVIEGDCENTVQEKIYSWNMGVILDYAQLPENSEQTTATDAASTFTLTGTANSVTEPIATFVDEGVEIAQETEGYITVSFVINNDAYTNDNGTTHVAVNLTEKNNPAGEGYSVDGGLTYTYWTRDIGKYKHKVTGTGTLMTCSIPVGTSLNDNSLTKPSVSITNISGSSRSYASVYNWVTSDGLICNEKTAFFQDTTLNLHLFENSITYGLNWVCNYEPDGGTHSVYSSGISFALGQSLSAPYIPTADYINSTYVNNAFCTAGPDYGMTFLGWYLKNETTGEEIDFGAGVPLLAEYVDPNSDGHSIKVYARWSKPIVTVTFKNSETVVTTMEVEKNSALGTLPEEPEYTGEDDFVFLGWTAEGIDGYVTEETVFTENTVLYAEFGETEYYEIYFHDIDPNGIDREKDGQEVEISQMVVPKGHSITEELSGERLIYDNTPVEDNIWYTLAEDGAKNLYDLNTAVTGDLHLYTYSYKLELTLSEASAAKTSSFFLTARAAEVTVTDNGVLTIVIREGELIQASDFVVDGVDYSMYTWTKEDKTSLNLSSLIGQTLTESITATSTQELAVDASTGNQHIAFYAIVNNERKLVKEDDLPVYKFNADRSGRYRLSEVVLESIYSDYGMDLTEDDQYKIAFSANSATAIWNDVALYTVNGTSFFGLQPNATDRITVYYLPNVTGTTNGYDTILNRRTWENYRTSDSFYSITVTDDNHLIYGADEEVPGVRYVLTGNAATVTVPLPAAENKYWQISGATPTGRVENNDGTISYTFENVTAPITLTATELPSSTITANFYVCVDGVWTKIRTSQELASHLFGTDSAGRYSLSAHQMEAVFGEYGFRASDIDSTNDLYFAHSDENKTTLWVRPPEQVGDKWYINGLGHTGNVNFYYLPGNETPHKGIDRNNYTTEWSFYSVTIYDPDRLIYGEGDTIPPVRYIFTGGSTEVTVPVPTDWNVSWIFAGMRPASTTPNDDGTVTYTFENVTAPIRLQAFNGTFEVSYDINLPDGERMSGIPTILGSATAEEHIESLGGGKYIVHTPSLQEYNTYFYASNGKNMNAWHTYVFEGWIVNGNGNVVIPAGAELTAEDLLNYAQPLNLTAKWTKLPIWETVNFYVNLGLEVEDTEGNASGNPDEDFTASLHSTQLYMDPPTNSREEDYGVIVGPNQTATALIDAEIRKLAGGVTADYAGADREFSLKKFPDNEDILANIRKLQAGYIEHFKASEYFDPDNPYDVTEYRAQKDSNGNALYRIVHDNNQYIPVDELTSDNFTIRWYVFKYHNDNGWHVDGVLVRKAGKLTVTKIFYGDKEAIANAKKDYSITVNGEDGNQVYNLNLSPQSLQNPDGYYSYDETIDRYMWVIELTMNEVFTLKEHGYIVDNFSTTADYMVTNADAGNLVARTTYPAETGVPVTARTYENDVQPEAYKTVTFFNGYVDPKASKFYIRKIDERSNPLTGVTFQLLDSTGENPIPVYPTGEMGDYSITPLYGVTADPQGLITTNTDAVIEILGVNPDTVGESVTYTLKEYAVPNGYELLTDPIRLTITKNADGTFTRVLDGPEGTSWTESNLTIRVVNRVDTAAVTVRKIWEDGTNKPVKVQLYQNGVPMLHTGEDGINIYEVVLNEANNWTHTWTGLPFAVGSNAAIYSVRETWIGDTAYSSTIPGDGYTDYVVTYDTAVTAENGDVSLIVKNRVFSAEVSFTKTDGVTKEALENAYFQLYTDPTCTVPYSAPAKSNASGVVTFGQVKAGTYYMKETIAPDGYIISSNIMQVVIDVDGISGVSIRLYDSESGKATGDLISTISNDPIPTADILIQKVNPAGAALTGASFELYKQEGKDWRKLVIDGSNLFEVDENGQFRFEELRPGEYKLKEVSAPAGHYRVTEEIFFTVEEDGTVRCESDANGKWSFTSGNENTITVVNAPGSELPETGGMGTHFGTMVGLLMMAGSLLYGFLLRRIRERGAV